MNKKICLLLVLALSVLICACTGTDAEKEKEGTSLSSNETATSYQESEKEDSTISLNETITSYEEVSETPVPSHSELYLPDCSQQQMFDYFEEIVLHMEYSTGNSTVVQKWNEPLCYRINGTATKKDLEVLTGLFAQLNKIAGFPGIYAAADGEQENLTICFLGLEDFNLSFSECINGEDAYGATEFWYYNDTNEIHTARIGYRTDIDQTTRVSILIEEIINTLGISDTELREDSIVYQYSNENTALSDVDWVILKLLYDPQIKCGMNADNCRDVVRELYY